MQADTTFQVTIDNGSFSVVTKAGPDGSNSLPLCYDIVISGTAISRLAVNKPNGFPRCTESEQRQPLVYCAPPT